MTRAFAASVQMLVAFNTKTGARRHQGSAGCRSHPHLQPNKAYTRSWFAQKTRLDLLIDKSTCLARDAPAPTSALFHTVHHRQAPISKRANSTLASPIHSSRRALAVGPCSIRFPIVGPEKRGRKVNRRPTSDSGVAAERTCCTLSLPKKRTTFGRHDRNRS